MLLFEKNSFVLALVLSIAYTAIIGDGPRQINEKEGHFFISDILFRNILYIREKLNHISSSQIPQNT